MSDTRTQWQRIGVVAVIALSFAYLLSASWFRWGHLVIDTFRDMRVADDMLSGKVLYRDFYHEYGPLMPYLSVLLCRVFGLWIGTFAGLGMAMTAVTAILVYRITRLFSGRLASVLTVLVFLHVFAFGIYQHVAIFNYILPYSSATTLVVLFSLAALLSFLRFILRGGTGNLWGWGLAMVCAFLTRPEMAVVVWGGFVVAGAIAAFGATEPVGTGRGRLFGTLAAPLAAAALCYGLYFLSFGGWENYTKIWLGNMAAATTPRESLVVAFSGTQEDVMLILRSLLIQGVGFSVLGAGTAVLVQRLREPDGNAAWLAAGVAAVFGAVVFLGRFLFTDVAELQYRCLPALLILAGAGGLVRVCLGKGDRPTLAFLTLCGVSGTIIARTVLASTPLTYGFCLTVPAVMVYMIVLFEKAPAWFARWNPHFSKPLYGAVVACLLALFASRYWHDSQQRYAWKNMKVETDVGTIYCDNDAEARNLLAAVRYLLTETPPSATAVAVPECMSLNVLSRRRCPIPYYSLTPRAFPMMGEDTIISSFKTNRVDYVVFVSRFTAEHGSPFFGITYGTNLYAWIRSNYDVVRQYGPYPFTSSEFGVAVFKRKE